MKIDLTQTIKQIDGTPYKPADDKILTLGMAVANILVVQKSTDPLKSYQMTNEFLKDETDLKAEDLVFVKKVIKDNAMSESARYYPHISGQCLDILEKEGVQKKEAVKAK